MDRFVPSLPPSFLFLILTDAPPPQTLPILHSPASFGQAGSAVFPFIVGAISQKHGLEALNPVVTAMLVALIVVWVATPRVPKKRD